MYRYASIGHTPAERVEWEQKWGNFNQFPPNWREVTEAEIASGSSVCRTHTPLMQEFRQMGKLEPGSEPLLAATLFFMHDETGWAMSFDYWNKRIRYFLFGCEHSYIETSRPAGNRSGMHTAKCTKCGYKTAYDTSD